MIGQRVRTNLGTAISLEEADIQALKASLRGELLRPTDDGYDQTRQVWNGLIDRRPALVAHADAAHADPVGGLLLCQERAAVRRRGESEEGAARGGGFQEGAGGFGGAEAGGAANAPRAIPAKRVGQPGGNLAWACSL